MIVRLAIVFGPSPSAQVDVAPSTGGVDPDIWAIKKNTEPSGALRSSPHHRTSRPRAFIGRKFTYRPRGKLNLKA